MICITGSERTSAELRQRLATYPDALHEVRLDLLEQIDERAMAACASQQRIITCRPKREGGGYRADEQQRIDVLLQACERAPGYIDVELSAPVPLRQKLRAALHDKTKLVLSWHDFDGDQPVPWSKLRRADADVLKVAKAIDDATELTELVNAAKVDGRPTVVIGMGPAGQLSRVLYRRCGSPWTYVVPAGSPKVAPGQLTVELARKLRVQQGEELTPVGLIGGPQIATSPGPLVYNAIFRQLNANYIYLPVVTGRAERVLPLLELLQFSGCSVTMPAKEVLARQLAADHLDDGARALAALNTLVCRAGQWTGANTDVLAVYSLLEDECRDAKKRVLVLGAGGAARAAVYALSKLGCHVTVCGRTAERSAALADDLGVQSVPWEQRAAQPFDIVINATPIGADGISDPLEQVASFENRTVVDAVLARKDTPLLQRARADGARVVDGRAWWLEQGAQQITMLTPLPITREQIAEQLYETTDE